MRTGFYQTHSALLSIAFAVGILAATSCSSGRGDSERFFDLVIQGRQANAKALMSSGALESPDVIRFFRYNYSAREYLDKYDKDGRTYYIFQLEHGVLKSSFHIAWDSGRVVYLSEKAK